MRDARIPTSSPLITVPMTWPRRSGPASVAASGMRIIATTDVAPTATSATPSALADGAAAHAAAAPAAHTSRTVTRRRRSTRSPSGPRNANPSRYPAWAQVTSSPARASETSNASPTTFSSGWT